MIIIYDKNEYVMINKIIIRDFFSFRGENTIKLNRGVNLLVGINGSGKTSFINALRLLLEGVCGEGVSHLIQEVWGGFGQVVNFNGNRNVPYFQITYVLDHKSVNSITPAAKFQSDIYYRITVSPVGNSYTISEKLFTQQRHSGGEFVYLDFRSGEGRLSTRTGEGGIVFQEYTADSLSGSELVLRQINDPIHYLPIYAVRRAIEALSVYNSFEVGEGSRIRRPAEYSTGERLRKNGDNLTQILNDLKLRHAFEFARVDEYLHRVNPAYDGIGIDNRYGQSYLYIHEKNLSRAVEALHISDGTLRFLLMESIFLNPNRGCVVAVDEQEKGLHPDMIRSLAEMIKYAGKQTQIIIATHSPHLLNQFELNDIVVFEKDEENRTCVKRVSEEDFEDWDGELLPGLLWLNGKIGGKRW